MGLLVSLFPAAQYGPLYFRDLDMDKTEALKLHKGSFDKRMQISKTSYDYLRWWFNSADSLFKPIVRSQTEVTLITDASSLGWDGVLDKVNIGG